ncbi:MAG: signal peptidase I [Pseudomonadales bacterium]|nr:signal peptidase I [Pseudomonadales bacterium]
MDVDLPAILFWAVLACSAIWLIDVLFLRKKRLDDDPEAKDPAPVEYAKSFFPVLLLVLILRSFLAEPYQIPSESMVPTLQVGDFILVNKYAYGLRLPVFGTKVFSVGDPEPGDVMVFIPPHDPRYFIKRVIGVPGDEVRYENKALYINGERLEYDLVGTVGGTRRNPVKEYIETIQGVPHSIYKDARFESTQAWQIPEGRYLMMGDNRDKSQDSRAWGLAYEKDIVGKAVAIWLHKEPGWQWPTFSRNGWLNPEEKEEE